MLDGVISKIPSLTTAEQRDLTNLIVTNKGVFGQHCVKKLVVAINSRASTSVLVPSSARGVRKHTDEKPQDLLYPLSVSLFTNDEHAVLIDPSASWATKLSLAVRVYGRWGVRHPSEQTRKWLIALLTALHFKTLPRYRWLYEQTQQFSTDCGKSVHYKATPVYLQSYGASLAELNHSSPGLVESSLGSEQPADIDVPNLVAVANFHIPLRKNSKLIADEEKHANNTYLGTLNLSQRTASAAVEDRLAALENCESSQAHNNRGARTPMGSWAPASRTLALENEPYNGDDSELHTPPPQRNYASLALQRRFSGLGAPPQTPAHKPPAPVPVEMSTEQKRIAELEAEINRLKPAPPAGVGGTDGGADAEDDGVLAAERALLAASKKGRGKGRGRGRGRGGKPAPLAKAVKPVPLAKAVAKKASTKAAAASVAKPAKKSAVPSHGAKPIAINLTSVLKPSAAKECGTANTFACRCYAAATKQCKAKGVTDAVLRATRAVASATGTAYWHKHN